MPITNVDQSTKIVLGAFDDLVSTPTLDESQLSELPRFIGLTKISHVPIISPRIKLHQKFVFHIINQTHKH